MMRPRRTMVTDRVFSAAMRITQKFGGKRFALRFMTCRLLYWLGRYDECKAVDWSRVRRLVFVCSGNICRSAYGAALAQRSGVDAASFGIHARTGTRADPTAIRIAAQSGIDLRSHVTTGAADFNFKDGDLLLAMEPLQLGLLRQLAPRTNVQMSLLGLWSRSRAPYVPDPYGMSDRAFVFIFSLIACGVQQILKHVTSEGV